MEDPRLSKLKDILIDSTIDYLQSEISDKSINAARSVLKDLSPSGNIEGMTPIQEKSIKDAMGEAPFKFGS